VAGALEQSWDVQLHVGRADKDYLEWAVRAMAACWFKVEPTFYFSNDRKAGKLYA
jgi:hypothetical protein